MTQIVNGVTEGYLQTEKQAIVAYSILAAFLRNSGVIAEDEALRVLFFLIDYNLKDRKFRFSSSENVNDNFKVEVVVEYLSHVDQGLFLDFKSKMFLVLFMLYVLSRSYIPSQLEFRVIDCLKRLNPYLHILERSAGARMAEVLRMMEEKDVGRLRDNLGALEGSARYAFGQAASRKEEDASSKISKRFEEIRERKINHSMLKMEEEFHYDLKQMANKDLTEMIKNGSHSLSHTNVNDLRKKNESKNNSGVKLLLRSKNKYESKPLICDPRTAGGEIEEEDSSSESGEGEESLEEQFEEEQSQDSEENAKEEFMDMK